MKQQKAFTLVEILIVVVILGILAALVIPSFANSTMDAKRTTLSTDLQLLRRFILVYKAQHLEVAPGYPNGNTSANPTECAFVDQATLASNDSGRTSAAGSAVYNRGPYLSKVPANPLNGKRTVQVLCDGCNFPANGNNSHGWVYKPSTGQIRPDSPGTDANGKRYYDY